MEEDSPNFYEGRNYNTALGYLITDLPQLLSGTNNSLLRGPEAG